MTESTSEPREQIKEVAVTTDNLTELDSPTPVATKPKDSYVKLAMRNMVRKGRQSLWHFFLTTVGLVGLLIGLAYLTKP
jgi:hypothetical protein